MQSSRRCSCGIKFLDQVANGLHVTIGHLKSRRQPDRLFAKPSAVWKVGIIAPIRFLSVKRKPKAAAGGSIFREKSIELITMLGQSVDPLWLFAAVDLEWKNVNAFHLGQLIVVNAIGLPDAFESRVQFFQLSQASRGLKVCQFEIESDAVMHIGTAGATHRPALIFQLAQTLKNNFVI